MIESLTIRDFALVDELTLELAPGFTVLTGETGAGKSILLQALGLLLGDRADREAVRAGAPQARVEGLFEPDGATRAALLPVLEEAGVPWEAGEPLVIARTVGAEGRSRAHVNGAMVPVAVLARVGAHLVEVSSQHQHQGLLREETHQDLLDAALDETGRAALAAYRKAYGDWQAADAEVRRLEGRERTAKERAEYLRYQADEIRAARLEPGEEPRLREERDLLAHATKLQEAYAAAEAEVYSGPDAALDRVARATRSVEGAASRDPEAAAILTLLADARAALDEVGLRLRERHGALDADPGRLEAVEDRLEVLRRLERKHGVTAEALLTKLEGMEAELWELENAELAVESARAARDRAWAAVSAAGARLRAARAETAAALSERIAAELRALALGGAPFQVELVPAAAPGPAGTESVRFLLAPNPGEPPRPLSRIASGGELSRVLLALKNALRDTGVGALVFDEVDAGIGGVTADAVADRLAEIARACQVVCITHLPQIASRAVHHFRVEKAAREGRTVTRVRRLEGAERVEELARMLGGRHVTETTRQHARELVGRSAAQ